MTKTTLSSDKIKTILMTEINETKRNCGNNARIADWVNYKLKYTGYGVTVDQVSEVMEKMTYEEKVRPCPRPKSVW